MILLKLHHTVSITLLPLGIKWYVDDKTQHTDIDPQSQDIRLIIIDLESLECQLYHNHIIKH